MIDRAARAAPGGRLKAGGGFLRRAAAWIAQQARGAREGGRLLTGAGLRSIHDSPR